MKKLVSCLAIASMVFTPISFAAKSIEGYWAASSPFFWGRPLAIVKTYIINNQLCGEIVKVIPLNGSFGAVGKMQTSGPVMMCGYKLVNGRWEGGKIYEQITAKIYPSTVMLSENGNHLLVRGYRGPFYRTVTWDRVR